MWIGADCFPLKFDSKNKGAYTFVLPTAVNDPKSFAYKWKGEDCCQIFEDIFYVMEIIMLLYLIYKQYDYISQKSVQTRSWIRNIGWGF